MVFQHAAPEDKRRWEEFELRSFVDDNPTITWCTAPGYFSLFFRKCEISFQVARKWRHVLLIWTPMSHWMFAAHAAIPFVSDAWKKRIVRLDLLYKRKSEMESVTRLTVKLFGSGS